MPNPRVNHSREIPSAHPTMSLALLVQVGAVPGPPGASSIIGYPPGLRVARSLASPRDAAARPPLELGSHLVVGVARVITASRAGLRSGNLLASIELNDDIPRDWDGQIDLGQ